ncbi:hypothetical protein H6G36_29540 [Anabaena minutissima FACHB-250]|nr:hypothetical protein [Anabaena minutissima FACHB-250]
MTTTKKPSKVDWAIATVLFVPSFAGFIWWITQPKLETKSDCYERVANEISARKKASGEVTIKNQQEIEAIASEIKSLCP